MLARQAVMPPTHPGIAPQAATMRENQPLNRPDILDMTSLIYCKFNRDYQTQSAYFYISHHRRLPFFS
jgi:hypothetical protein